MDKPDTAGSHSQFQPTRCALAVALVLTTSVATAARIEVDGNNAFFSEDGSCSIQEAIIAANTDKAVDSCKAGNGADVIILPGRSRFILQSFAEDLQGYNGLPTITSEITIRGNNAVIKRPADGGFDKFRIMRVDKGTLTLNKVTIENGVADFKGNGPFAPGVYGGGINIIDSTVTIESSTITGSTATTGGGISATESDLNIIDSYISYNEGGGINTDKSTVTIQNTNITTNRGHIGGGLSLNRTTLTLTNSIVSGNSVDSYGGGIDGQYSTFTIDGSTISNNVAGTYDGGGIHLGDGVLTLSSSTVSDNFSGRDGGGIKLDENAQGSIASSTIARNTASRGGGGVEMWTNSLSIDNSTISSNTAATQGGGVTAWYGAAVTVTNSTVAENAAQEGSGAFNDPKNSFIFFKNSIVASNKLAKNCSGGGTRDSGNNFFGDESCSGESQGNPKLGPLQINGKTTLETHALLGGSAAIDAGDNSICEGGLVANLDQRGFKRPFDGDGDGNAICDIGAHENQVVEAPPVDGGIQPAHSGVWFNPARDGEGYFIYISDNGGQRSVTMTFYTYDNGQQVWLIGTQQLTPGFSTVSIPMTVTTGTSFSDFNPKEIGRNEWGTITLKFNSCERGTISYFSPELGSGDIDISPLATVSGLACNADGF
ncbi:MAG TPA: hypothetical protein ENJ32_11720 [Crenotrichaceae bacterium]|nr:hypothetical protein [Crenotrichaceae bacterium]